jgi:SAM-dependent methyltransferase
MSNTNYLMESDEESFRLDIKIDEKVIEQQAKWAGIRPGMRVADLGCGPGRITSILYRLVQPGGSVVGIDGSADRLQYAKQKYGCEGIEFVRKDLTDPLGLQDEFDFIWVRFVLEYYRATSSDMVANFSKYLQPGGILCLLDLDQNQTNFYGSPVRLERTLERIIQELQDKYDFDPCVGSKLYSFLYDLGFSDIAAKVETYKMLYGKVDDIDIFNTMKKIEVIPKKIQFDFEEYEGGYEEFYKEAEAYFFDPRRFSYTPLVICRGRKPTSSK